MSRLQIWLLCGVLLSSVGCGTSSTTEQTQAPSAEGAKYLLSAEPPQAKSVAEAKKTIQDGEDVTLIGRIGGSVSPFVAGRASFTVVDTSLVPCNERANDSCPTPWDYCCDSDQLAASTAIIKLVDAEGKTLPLDAKKELAMKELQTIVVTGKAKRDEAGNLSVLAAGIFVKKSK